MTPWRHKWTVGNISENVNVLLQVYFIITYSPSANTCETSVADTGQKWTGSFKPHPFGCPLGMSAHRAQRCGSAAPIDDAPGARRQSSDARSSSKPAVRARPPPPKEVSEGSAAVLWAKRRPTSCLFSCGNCGALLFLLNRFRDEREARDQSESNLRACEQIGGSSGRQSKKKDKLASMTLRCHGGPHLSDPRTSAEKSLELGMLHGRLRKLPHEAVGGPREDLGGIRRPIYRFKLFEAGGGSGSTPALRRGKLECRQWGGLRSVRFWWS
jgi:hypothetical protein